MYFLKCKLHDKARYRYFNAAEDTHHLTIGVDQDAAETPNGIPVTRMVICHQRERRVHHLKPTVQTAVIPH